MRELSQGANFPSVRLRPGASGPDACREASTYGMGMYAATDCELGLTLSHGGGYPGYGSHVLVLPDYGVGIFALANRTYAGPARAGMGRGRGAAARRASRSPARAGVAPALATAYAAVGTIFTSGSVTAAGDVLAMNFLMDRDAEHWARELAALKAQVGTCDTTSPIVPTGALSGDFTWRCEHGRVKGSVLLAPTRPPRIQALSMARATP